MKERIAPEMPAIRTADALALFDGKIADMATALRCTRQTIYTWGEFVPELRVYQLREMFPEEFEKRGTKAA